MAPAFVAWPALLLRAIADAAAPVWPADGGAQLRGREPGRMDLRLTPRPDGAEPHPDGAKPHPETDRAPSISGRISRFTVF